MDIESILRGPIKSQVQMLQSGEIPLDLWLSTLVERLPKLDQTVRSFLKEPGRSERVFSQIDELPARWPHPSSRPPLYGIPFGVKDIFAVDGLPTRAGSSLPPSALRMPQSSLVTRLVNAGAVVLGKTVSTEFAFYSPGPTRNPKHLDHSPGGSSSGSAAAVSAAICPFALGTQTIGSIIRPASYCGVIGFKPSYGRVTLEGVFPFSPLMDHPGIICNRLDDLIYLAPIFLADMKPLLVKDKPRLGIPHPKYLAKADAAVLDNYQNRISILKSQGFQVTQTDLFENIDHLEKAHHDICSRQFYETHAKLWHRYADRYSPQSVAYMQRGKLLGPGMFSSLQDDLLLQRAAITKRLDNLGIDLIIAPSTTTAAPEGLDSTGSPLMSLPFSYYGLPSITLPDGQDAKGLPLGLQIGAAPGRDEYLLIASQDLGDSIGSP